MPAPIRDVLCDAVHAALVAALPSATVQRARRSDPDGDDPMPLVIVRASGQIAVSEAQSPQDSAWDVQFQVIGYADGGDDEEAERALSDLEASVIAALSDAPLTSPLGGDLTTGVMLVSSDAAMSSADDSARAAGSFAATFRATIFTSYGSVSL